MFATRVSTRFPSFTNGKDIAFHCTADDGGIYFCKQDISDRPIRATEWIATLLAKHLGIPVPAAKIIEDEHGATFFGSRSPGRYLASRFELDSHISRTSVDETGRHLPWIGQFFAQLWAYDLFVCNPDRDLQNLILDLDGSIGIVRAIDFASADLIPLSAHKFPIESDPTVRIGKLIRFQHGSHKASAFEMLERIKAVPQDVISGILGQMPRDWLTEDQAGGFIEVWSNGHVESRVAELKALIADGW